MSEKKSGDFDVDRKDTDSGMMQMTGGFSVLRLIGEMGFDGRLLHRGGVGEDE